MLVDGYTLIETLTTGRRAVLYRARRGSEPVTLKVPSEEYLTPEELGRFRYDYEVARSLDTPAVLRPLAFEQQGNSVAIVLEDWGGVPLRSLIGAPLAVEDVLLIAVEIARALGELHQRHVIHKNVEPSSILVDPRTHRIALTNFEIASRLTQEDARSADLHRLEGLLPYVSPEQTGRMGRGIDYRTDFYSLGATLYEALTGRPPFVDEDPMTLVHHHIAVEPQRPHAQNPLVPPAVSDVVMKLLAKNAEDRYQSTFGIIADLRRCLAGPPADFVPGEGDVSASFRIPQKLYGREADKALLDEAFRRVAAGATELMVVYGYSGVGKSALVNGFHRPIDAAGGHFCAGKFDQLQNVPYSALIRAFAGLVRQVLAESEDALGAWRERLLAALGADGQVLIDVIPEVAMIVGRQPPVPALGPSETQTRFNTVFQQFMGVFAGEGHPLVLFLDDLQWADSGSLNLIKTLILDPSSRHVLLVGAYRDSEVDGAHPLMLALAEIRKGAARVGEIALRPLERADVGRLVADTLDARGAPETDALAELVYSKTQGNPFFVNQFFRSLHDRDLITFDHDLGRFRWSLDRIREEGITDNVVRLMVEKIQELSLATQHALRLAACIGNTFDLGTLSVVYERPPEETAAALWEAIAEGLVVPVGDAYKYVATDAERSPESVVYSFLHDRVQEAAYALISDDTKKDVHLRVGRLLLANTPPERIEGRIFDIVNQLDISVELITRSEERAELARHNLVAGERARGSTAYSSALKYLTVGIDLLPEDAFETAYDLAFSLHKQRATCQYVMGQFEAAEAGFDRILAMARTESEKGAIFTLKQALCTSQGRYLDSIKAGTAGLRLYGIDVPDDDDALKAAVGGELEKLLGTLRAADIASFVDLPEARDQDDRARALLLSHAVVYGAALRPDVFQLLSLLLVNRSIERGNSAGSSQGYWTCAMFLGPGLGHYAWAYELGRVAMALTERYDDLNLRSTTYFGFGGYVSPWRRGPRPSIPLLEKSYVGSVEASALIMAGFSTILLVWMGFMGGDELSGLFERAQKHYEARLRVGQSDVVNSISLFQRAELLLMKGELPDEPRLSEAYLLDKLSHYTTMHPVHYTLSLQVALVFGDLERAKEVAPKAEACIMATFGNVMVAEFYYYQALLFCALHATASPEEREAQREKLVATRDKLEAWADNGPDMFLHKHLLVSAEMARVAGEEREAMDLYDRAIDAAANNELVQDQAMASELAGRFYLALGRRRAARAYLVDARYAYARWGALAKVADMDRRYVGLLPAAGSGDRADTSAALDLVTVMKASQAISTEIVLSELLRKLMTTILENAGAQRCFLVLKGDSPMLVAAHRTADEAPVSLRTAPDDASHELCWAIVRYVERTLEPVVLGDAANAGQFRLDPYVASARPASVLCMPVRKQNQLLGVLYLENNLVTDAFTPERRAVLEILSSQAAISLENARLYDTLDNRVKEQTRELRESNDELREALRRLRATQDRLIAQEKLASLGALTAGIAHEIKNPLNFINNFSEIAGGLAQELGEALDEQRARLDPASRAALAEGLGSLSSTVTKIGQHGRRADDIINGMLLHARGAAGSRDEVDLNALVASSASLGYHGFGGKGAAFQATVREEYDPAVGLVELSPSEMSRVFVNVMNNACYAVAAKQRARGAGYEGTIDVRTRALPDRVEVRIRDNGTGIAREVVDKIFNPFFTTKPTNEGTGLGLSISHTIVQGHGGEIRVDTEPGEGTELVITLPLRAPAAGAPDAPRLET